MISHRSLLRSRILAAAALCAALASSAKEAAAQTSGMFGSRNMGSSVSAGTGGAFGGSSRTVTGGAGSGGGVGGGTENAAAGGTINGNERFLRENRQGAFVGGDSADNTALRSQGANGAAGGMNGMGGMGGMNGLGGLGQNRLGQNGLGGLGQNRLGQNGFGGLNGMNGTNNASRGSISRATRGGREYAVKLIPDFEFDRPEGSALQTTVVKRLAQSSALKKLPGVDVAMDGRTAVLSGAVPSDRDRKLIEAIVKLEPGVSEVDNQLTVVVAPSANR